MPPLKRALLIGILVSVVSIAIGYPLRMILPGESNYGYRQGIGWFIFAMGWFPYLYAQAREKGSTVSLRAHLFRHLFFAVVSAVIMGLLAGL